MTKLFSKTKSPCPVCKKIIDADVIEKEGVMLMQKNCPEHGNFETKIAKYAWYYKGLNSFYNNLYPEDFYERRNPLIYTSEISQKCSLDCAICYAGFLKSRKSEKEDIRLEVFKKHLEKIKNKGIWIHLSGGGEPTLREDLPEIIRLISESGNAVGLATNGVLIANDFNYLKKLKNSGLENVYIWVDTLNNEEVYQKIRNGNFIEIKKRALENLKKLKIPTRIFQVVVMGLNDGEIGEILEFVKKNNFINTLWIRGYNYLGKCGFPSSDEFLVDELVEIVANQSGRLFSLEDCYYFQKILYALAAFRNEFRCYEAQLMIVPRRKEKSLRNIFNFKKFSSVLDEFEKIWLEDRKRAKIYFYSKYLPALFKNPILAYSFFKTGISKFGWNSFNSRHYCTISINSVKLSDYDVERSYRQCINRSFDLGPENNIPRCYELLNLYSPDNSPCL